MPALNPHPLPLPDCPDPARITEHVPMAHVADVDRSVDFYARLGFFCDSRHSGGDGRTFFASMSSGKARIMFALASGPVDAAQQAVLFYMYSRNVRKLREHLLARGLADGGLPPGEHREGKELPPVPPGVAVFEPVRPFYMPAGEIRIHDPDGYVILVGQLEP
jgi:catechol 2,3-dioxygenase-like lactoylglutathione lyase family enzyme